jgi:hypothetical protein
VGNSRYVARSVGLSVLVFVTHIRKRRMMKYIPEIIDEGISDARL